VLLGLLFSWFAWVTSCSLREGERVSWWAVCDTSWKWVPWLSLVGAVAVVAAWLRYRRRRRTGLLAAVIAVASVVTLSVWVVYGDPSGNFDGLRSD